MAARPARRRRTPTASRTGEARRVRYAVVGLGYISQVAMLPAFAGAQRNSALVALISGDDAKLRALGRKYGVRQLVRYEDYERLMASAK